MGGDDAEKMQRESVRTMMGKNHPTNTVSRPTGREPLHTIKGKQC